MLFSSHSSWYTLDPYHFMWDEGFFLREGDGRRFLLNIYRWLAAPSSKSNSFGGFRESEQKQLFDISPRLRESVRQKVSRTLGGRPRQGIIGVHTRFSGGGHTVSEFCTEAKRLGLDYLVFTEDREKMTAAKWAQLIADCRRGTDDPAVEINVLTFGRDGGRVVAHNPTEKPLQAELTLADGLPSVAPLRAEVDLAPGAERLIEWR